MNRLSKLGSQVKELRKENEQLKERIDVLEKEVETALNTLASGVADNLKQMWDNEVALATTIRELGDSVADRLEKLDGQKQSICSGSKPEEG